MKQPTFQLSITAREDGSLEAAYIKLSNEKIVSTEAVLDSVVMADFDRDHNLVGVEFLEPVPVSVVTKIANKLKTSQRKRFKEFVAEYASRLVAAT